jgi:hypothetical protein
LSRAAALGHLRIFSVGACAALMAATEAPRAAVAQRMQPVIVQGFCISSTAPTVYVTGVVELQTRTAAAGALSVFRQYSEYLRGRYDFDTTPLGASCQAEQTRTATIAGLRREGKQIVQVDWKPVPLSPDDLTLPVGLPSDHMWCFSRFSPETLYVTGPVHVSASQGSLSTWNIGFTQYLKEKYGYQGAVDCSFDRATTAKAIVTSRLAGARAGNRKIVDTQWKPGLTKDGPSDKT